MKQILQDIRKGETLVVEVPAPSGKRGHVSILTRWTLVSAGTERMLVDFGKGNLIQKARQQPDKVRQVLDKVKTDGLLPTMQAVRNKLDTPLPLGYCNVGRVLESASDVSGFEPGARVVSNGHHAESVVVPKHLCAKIPDGVDDQSASFTVLGAIALQGIRLLNPTLGETIVVTGLGLIGLLAVQILRANGCRVIGLDFDPRRLDLARKFGAEVVALNSGFDPTDKIRQLSQGIGADGVLITASTSSNAPVAQAANMCRKRGRIVLVGVVGLELSRADFYEKEISFQVSCSYGPGRYDPNYEEGGLDYPVGFVRWTEARNFAAVLNLMAEGKIDVKPLISARFGIEQAVDAYQRLADSDCLGILLEYTRSPDEVLPKSVAMEARAYTPVPAKVKAAVLGAGNYAGSVLLPAFAHAGIDPRVIASRSGVSAAHLAKKFGFASSCSEVELAFSDPQVNTVVIATRHDTHAEFVARAVGLGKHTFVEKPLAITRDQINRLKQVFSQSADELPVVMVGFNRRYSAHAQKIKQLLEPHHGVCAMVYTINAGQVDAAHWTQTREIGGGRVIGEVCHFIDLLRYLAGSAVASVNATHMDSANADSLAIMLKFTNGAIGSIQYLANGAKSFPKERLEVFAAGGILQLDNFKRTKSFRWPGFGGLRTMHQDKGQKACVAAFVNAIETGDRKALIPLDEILEVTEICLSLADAGRNP